MKTKLHKVVYEPNLVSKVRAKMTAQKITVFAFETFMNAPANWVDAFLEGKFEGIRIDRYKRLFEFLESDQIPERPLKTQKLPEFTLKLGKGEIPMPKNFKPYCGMIMPRICIQESKHWKKDR